MYTTLNQNALKLSIFLKIHKLRLLNEEIAENKLSCEEKKHYFGWHMLLFGHLMICTWF